jgi:hypothetical protein
LPAQFFPRLDTLPKRFIPFFKNCLANDAAN